MILDKGNFVLRPWSRSDATSLAKNADDLEIWKNLRNSFPNPYTLRDAKAWIKHASKQQPTENFAIEVEGVAVGAIGIEFKQDIYCKNAEIGYWLGRNYWGCGIMTKAVSEMVDYTFKHFPVRKIYAEIFDGNEGSEQVLLRNDFILEARLAKHIFKSGQYKDVLIYSYLI